MITTERNNATLQITMEAENGNLIDTADIGAFLNCLSDAKTDDSVNGILLTGAGRAFCAGLKLDKDPIEAFRQFDELLYTLFSFPKPVIAAINGHSIGGGLLLQSCADYVVVANHPKIKFGLPEVKLGLTIDRVMRELLSFNVKSDKQLNTMLLTSDYITPEQAMSIGFADELAPCDALLAIARERLLQLESHPAASYRITKETVKRHTAEKMKRALDEKAYQVFGQINPR